MLGGEAVHAPDIHIHGERKHHWEGSLGAIAIAVDPAFVFATLELRIHLVALGIPLKRRHLSGRAGGSLQLSRNKVYKG